MEKETKKVLRRLCVRARVLFPCQLIGKTIVIKKIFENREEYLMTKIRNIGYIKESIDSEFFFMRVLGSTDVSLYCSSKDKFNTWFLDRGEINEKIFPVKISFKKRRFISW